MAGTVTYSQGLQDYQILINYSQLFLAPALIHKNTYPITKLKNILFFRRQRDFTKYWQLLLR